MTMIENQHFNCMKMVSCKVTTIENDVKRKLGGVGCWGHSWGNRGCRGVRGALGAGRTLGTQRPKGHIGGIGGS